MCYFLGYSIRLHTIDIYRIAFEFKFEQLAGQQSETSVCVLKSGFYQEKLKLKAKLSKTRWRHVLRQILSTTTCCHIDSN